jgi:hypothetical protein
MGVFCRRAAEQGEGMKRSVVAWVLAAGSLLYGNAAGAKEWMVGTELDVVPYLNDGYYASAIAGYGHWRARVVLTDITVPDFATQSGFDDNDLQVQAYIVDYYFKQDFEGWWVGPGFERWEGRVTEEDSGLRRDYTTDILTLGGGYTWRLGEHVYLTPWAAVHIPIGGDRNVSFANDTFNIDPVPEASIKLGLRF